MRLPTAGRLSSAHAVDTVKEQLIVPSGSFDSSRALRWFLRTSSLFLAILVTTFTVSADVAGGGPDQAILNRYLSATQAQQDSMRGLTMEVAIDAQIPKLKKEGKLHALRSISKVGKITYRMLGFSGDNTVKKEVIARYLQAETQAQDGPNISITPLNYKFKFKGVRELDGRDVYVFHISPRKKRVGLFKGQLWLDADTCMPVHEEGRFVKNPSIFFKKVEFARDYQIQNGLAIPTHMNSRVETRIVGPVELSVDYLGIAKEPEPLTAVTTSGSR